MSNTSVTTGTSRPAVERDTAVATASKDATARIAPEPHGIASSRTPVARFTAHFEQWVRELDPAMRGSTTTTRMFVGITLQMLVLLTALDRIPMLRDLFNLQFGKALILLALTVSTGFAMGAIEKRGAMTLRLFGAFSLLGSFLFQLYTWALVGLSKMPGALLLAALPIILVSFHGHLYQSALRRPLPLIASVLAIATAITLTSDAEHLPFFAVAAPLALTTHLLFGYQARLAFRARVEREALRAAVDAQILSERSADITRITGLLDELRGRSHDAGNALSGVLLNLPRFLELLEQSKRDEGAATEATVLGSIVSERLQNLKELLTDSRELLKARTSDVELVQPWPLVSRIAQDVSRTHPYATLVLTAPPERERTLPMYGGQLSLERIVTNIVLNAFEGNGTQKASLVQLSVAEDAERRQLVVEVSDNGPGFAPDLLEKSLDRLTTTKNTGTGLGVYTASRLLAASGGHLERGNRASGGALVRICLPLAESA